MLHIEYSFTTAESLASKLEKHLFGNVLIDIGNQSPPSETFFRKTIARHTVFVVTHATTADIPNAWLNTGASIVYAPDSIAQTESDRIKPLEAKPEAIAEYEASPAMIANHIASIAKFDSQTGLIPTVVSDQTGATLGLAYSNPQTIQQSLETATGTYWSRSRNEVWVKGLTSGATQQLLRVDLDCDQDTLRFIVNQNLPGFCHKNRWSCFSENENNLTAIERHLLQTIQTSEPGSYTAKLIGDRGLLHAKILEEAQEVVDATTRDEIIWETADLLYFAMTHALANDIRLEEITSELRRRTFKVSRRGGAAKPRFQSDSPTSQQ